MVGQRIPRALFIRVQIKHYKNAQRKDQATSTNIKHAIVLLFSSLQLTNSVHKFDGLFLLEILIENNEFNCFIPRL